MDSSKVALEKSFREKVTAVGQFLLTYADTSSTPAVAIYALGMSRNLVDPAQVQPALASLAKRFPNSEKINKLAADYNKTSQAPTSDGLVGKPAPDFTLPDVNGNPVALSSLKGKFVLVDFGPAGADHAEWKIPM